MRVWEFRDKNNYKWLLTEQEDKSLTLEVMTFSAKYDSWELFDQLQKDSTIKFQREYELEVKNG